MKDKYFIDTNVLVYARDATEPDNQRKAMKWLESLWKHRCGVVSYQVLQEYYVTVTRKLKPGLQRAAAREDIKHLLVWNPVMIGQAIIESAWRIEEKYKVSWWDSLIIAAAQNSGARFLLSEDLQPGMHFGAVEVINPLIVEAEETRFH